MYGMSDLFFFFSVITIFDALLFFGDLNSSSFAKRNVMIFLIIYFWA